MLQFKDVAPQESTLKSIGTVASVVGKGGYHELSNEANFKGTVKKNGKLTNVTLRLVNAKGQVEFVNCSAPVSKWLRESTSATELKERLNDLATMPILELPQFITEETDPNFGQPVINEETGEQLVIYSVSFAGGADMSATRVTVTEDMLKAEVAKRAINFEDLIAI